MAGLDWNDLRYFLAVARTGSTLAAGKSLGVSHTTAARRLAALEEALGTPLFERRPTGYVLTPAGEALVESAEAMEAAASQLVDAAATQSREASGTVKLTAHEIFGVTVLAPILRDLHKAHPKIRIELDTSEEFRDLAAGEADIALRVADRPAGGGLVGRRLYSENFALHCSRDYAAAHGIPRSENDLRSHSFIGGGGPGLWSYYRVWLEQNGLSDRVTMHQHSLVGLLAALRSGAGLAVLPISVGAADPDLLMCLPPDPANERGLWLLTHERLRHTPRVRVVLDFLADRLTRRAEAQPRRAEADDIMAPRVPSIVRPRT